MAKCEMTTSVCFGYKLSLISCTLQVKTLKPLSTRKLQQLCALMEEETYVDEQHIAAEGEVGEKFFITIMGTVRHA